MRHQGLISARIIFKHFMAGSPDNMGLIRFGINVGGLDRSRASTSASHCGRASMQTVSAHVLWVVGAQPHDAGCQYFFSVAGVLMNSKSLFLFLFPTTTTTSNSSSNSNRKANTTISSYLVGALSL